MDSLTTHKSKPRKTKKLARKSSVHIIFDMFSRAIEIIAVLVTIAKLSYHLVIAFEDSGVVAVIVSSRNLAFAVGNVIVIALITKSRLLSNQELDSKRKSNDLYEEFVQESSKRDVRISRTEMRNREEEIEAVTEKQSITEKKTKQSITEKKTKQSITEKKTKQSNHEKMIQQSITENIAKQSICVKTEEQSITEKKMKVKQRKPVKMTIQSIVEHHDITVKMEELKKLTDNMQIQTYQRSLSENLEEKSCCERLRISETGRFESDDELRYKIESFIARQRKNQNDD